MKLIVPTAPARPPLAIGLDAVLAIGDAEPQHRIGRSEEDSSLLALIDGRRTVAEILGVSRMPGSVAMRRLRALSERRIIRSLATRLPSTTLPPAAVSRKTQDLSAAADHFAKIAASARIGAAPARKPPESARSASKQPTASPPSIFVMIDDDQAEYVRTPVTPAPVLDRAPAPSTRRTTLTNLPQNRAPRLAPSPPRPASHAPSRALVPVTPADGLPVARPHAFGPGSRGQLPTALAAKMQELWFTLARRDWATLALIPAHDEGTALSVANALAEIGSACSDRPVSLLSAEGRELSPPEDWIFPRPERTPTPGPRQPPAGDRRVIALEPLGVNPMGITVAQAADAVVMVVETGVSDLTSARRVMQAIGRNRFVGCVMVPRG